MSNQTTVPVKEMKKVDTQFATSMTADFDENTWTFLMPEKYQVWAGQFAIVDKKVYDEMIERLASSPASIDKGNEAIEFADFISSRNYIPNDLLGDTWHKRYGNPKDDKTTAELYQLFSTTKSEGTTPASDTFSVSNSGE